MKHQKEVMIMVNEFDVFDWDWWELERDLIGFYFGSKERLWLGSHDV